MFGVLMGLHTAQPGAGCVCVCVRLRVCACMSVHACVSHTERPTACVHVLALPQGSWVILGKFLVPSSLSFPTHRTTFCPVES